MFTKSQASLIKAGLAELDLNRPLQQAQRAQFDSYFDFYNFDFSLSDNALFHTAGCNLIGNFEIVSQYFLPLDKKPRGTIILLHGYLDHSGLYFRVIEHCLMQGFAVLIFDMPGHGLSSGKAASIDSFDRYSESLLALLEIMETQDIEGPWHIVGQSTGSAVMIDCLLKEKFPRHLPLEKFIGLAPLLRPFAWKTSQYLFAMSRLFLSSTKRKFSQNSHDQVFLDFLKFKDPLQSKRLQRDWISAMLAYNKDFSNAKPSTKPIHIVQGTADTTVDWEYNLPRFADKFPAVNIEKIEGARHHLVNESEPYRRQVLALLDKALAS
ncbi:MAG: alpha/beta hydrolase [Pseudohongiellaceae bacterium]